jgi:hypothetical protein
MLPMHVSPTQFQEAMIEVNLAFEIANKRIDLLQEEVRQAQSKIDALGKPNKSK